MLNFCRSLKKIVNHLRRKEFAVVVADVAMITLRIVVVSVAVVAGIASFLAVSAIITI